MRLVLATRNPHKRDEFARLLPGQQVEVLGPDVTLPPETDQTFEQNALAKAHAAAQATGVAAIADDSGIAAEALDGAPGVLSARYAGADATDEENLAKLRAEVPADSGLAYVCALAYADPCGTERTFVGRCEGTMSAAERGVNGFGYDPIFIPAEGDGARTMAELGAGEKDTISHRGRAAAMLLEWLP